ncbi:hypothetical protein AVEN_265611-1 [Araneus ventricosus]|uniref:Transposase Tc1-like domain-containing protein n=1 Tax=Araneus ventricosus TaxID=182803 RepID=A0A4Y2J230_ARAVE|nr:hypothetical protein AVEN_265611-1 [Araneus ventricosus]
MAKDNFFKAREEDPEALLQAKMSSFQIKDEMQLPCTSRTIRNAMSRNTNVVCNKLKGQPSRSKRRTDSCLNFERRHLTTDTDWNDVVFSNEKKLHLDGPIGFKVYWYDIHKEKRLFLKAPSRRRMCRGLGRICSRWWN